MKNLKDMTLRKITLIFLIKIKIKIKTKIILKALA